MKFALEITIPLKERERLGISEDTIFETVYKDGQITVREVDEGELEAAFTPEPDDGEDEECCGCRHYCPLLGICTDEAFIPGGEAI